MPNKGRNLQSVNESLIGDEIKVLNSLSPGLGNKIHRLFVSLGRAHDATGGKSGTVQIQKQSQKDAKGLVQPAIELHDDRISGGADAVEDTDFVTLRQLREWPPCDVIAERLNECAGEDLDDLDGGDPVCLPTALSNSSPKATGLTNTHAVQVTNEFVYVLGDEGGAIAILHVYRRGAANTIVRVGRLEMTQLCTRMILQGEYIFATRSNTGDLTVINIRKPNAPVELSVSAQGGNGIHAQGRYVFCVQNGAIAVVDISNVGSPVQVGSAV